MRKTPTLVVGLLATVAIGGTAVAQTAPSHTADIGISPSKAGTTKKPKATTLKLNISANRAAGATASKIEISFPAGFKVNTKGFPTCSEATITDQGADACPAKSRLGTGTAGAVVNPRAESDTDPNTNPTVLSFDNTFFVGGPNVLNIFLQQTPGDVRAVLKGNITSGGRKLTIVIPEDLQQPATGVYSALTDIKTTLKGTTGTGAKKHGAFEFSKCTGGQVKVSTKLTYVPNPTPPSVGSSTTVDNVACKK